MTAEIAMLQDISKCTACRGCMVACKQWKNLPADPVPFDGEYQSHKDLSSKTYILIRMQETFKDKKVGWNFIKFQCMHCGVPTCALACPTGSLNKLDNGVVAFTESTCVGCGYCELNCPFSVPHVDEVTHKSTKCNLCIDRIEHDMVPACAKTCTADAILFGSRKEMTDIANARVEVLKKNYPNAQTYNVDTNDDIKGAAMMYVLTDKPSVFGLPDEPKVCPSTKVWKDIVQPGGKILIGAAAVAVTGAFIANSIMKKDKGGDKHE